MQYSATVIFIIHVDKIDNDNAAEVTQTQLTSNGLRCFNISIKDSVVEITMPNKRAGVDINGGMMLSMFFSVFVLSVGAPGVPGAGLVCLSVLLTQLNVPLAGIGLVMGLDSLLGMMRAMSNSLGDVTASLIVAKSEKKLDMEKYMS